MTGSWPWSQNTIWYIEPRVKYYMTLAKMVISLLFFYYFSRTHYNQKCHTLQSFQLNFIKYLKNMINRKLYISNTSILVHLHLYFGLFHPQLKIVLQTSQVIYPLWKQLTCHKSLTNLSHKVVPSTPRHERDSNTQL